MIRWLCYWPSKTVLSVFKQQSTLTFPEKARSDESKSCWSGAQQRNRGDGVQLIRSPLRKQSHRPMTTTSKINLEASICWLCFDVSIKINFSMLIVQSHCCCRTLRRARVRARCVRCKIENSSAPTLFINRAIAIHAKRVSEGKWERLS